MCIRDSYTASGEPRPMFSVLEELGLRDRFATQAVREVVACKMCIRDSPLSR